MMYSINVLFKLKIVHILGSVKLKNLDFVTFEIQGVLS
jgi:hypothetical protein